MHINLFCMIKDEWKLRMKEKKNNKNEKIRENYDDRDDLGAHF